MRKIALPFLLLLSGFSGLVYQVLWMRQLGLLFGNTSHATAVTLAAFFGGLAAGSWFWGRRSKAAVNPMRAYAWLEAGIAVTALLYFAVLALFYLIYPIVFQSVSSKSLLLAVKFLLALLLVFPPAFLMGGTIPMIGQAVIGSKSEFGFKAAWLYAINTVGAALGAAMTGAFLVRQFGFRATCFTAICITGLTALCAGLLSRGQRAPAEVDTPPVTPSAPAIRVGAKATKKKPGVKEQPITASPALSKRPVYAVCFISGFGFLTLEVVWTRLLAQIHTNSVYAFSTVLVLVLVALAGGAAVASKLARRGTNPLTLLAALLLLGGISVALSPFMFMIATDGFCVLDTSGTMLSYIRTLFGVGFITIGLPAFILGMIFPFLMKIEESFLTHAGSSIGRLSAINMSGAILGSLLCGFVFLSHFGMWRTLQLTAALYLIAGLFMPIGWRKPGLVIRFVSVVSLLLFFTLLSPVELRNTGWDPAAPPERTLEVWETSDCTVSVVITENNDCAIKVNSNYRLGSTQAAPQEHFQGKIPLLAFPETRSIFFIGVGTGISVGGALDRSFTALKRVVACDLFPEVIAAAKKYMTGAFAFEPGRPLDFTNGLFKDRRVEILAQDGRHYLMASGETFDMVNADLFLPYQSGAGSLYSREHFEHVKASLNPGGVFVQWLPMYQLTETEFGSIARTMLDVFEQVTVWRNNFIPGHEILALVGHRDPRPLPAYRTSNLVTRRAEVEGQDPANLYKLDLAYDSETALIFYCGNLTASKERFKQYPVNTDDRPVIEYTSPLSMRKREEGFIPTIVGPRYERLIDTLLAQCPPDKDPLLANQTPAQRKLVIAGVELHRCWLASSMEETLKANAAWARFVQAWTDQE